MPARVTVIVVAAVVLAGCGGSTPTPRAQVAGYVTKANAIERQLQAPLTLVTQNARGSALPQSGGTAAAARTREHALLGAWRTITALRARLAAVRAPADALRLRALLLELTDRQAGLTLQSARLVTFLPGFSAAIKPLGPATLRLERILQINQANGTAAVAAVYAQKAQALRAFRATTQTALARVERLSAPAVLLPTYRSELRALRGMGTASGQLADALGSGQAAKAAPLLSAFANAAAAPGALSVKRAQADAIRSYDRQVGQITELQTEVARERLRLASALK